MTDVATILPASATAQERSLEQATARVGAVPVPVTGTWNPDTCPANVLPWLAWAMAVDAWDSGWTETQKRSAIKSSMQVHRKKGTVGAVRESLASIGWDIRIREWFEPGGTGIPYTFTVTVFIKGSTPSDAVFQTVASIVERTKNVRSHATIEMGGDVDGSAYVLAYLHELQIATVNPN